MDHPHQVRSKEQAMPMISMKNEPEMEEIPGQMKMDEPKYPEDLCIELESDQLEKLGINVMPKVGTVMMITAKAVVKSNEETELMTGKETCIELQITDMEISKVEQNNNFSSVLYGPQ